MTAEITTVIGQLSISDGKWRSDAPNQVAVREPKSAETPGAGKGDLFVVVEIQGNLENYETVEEKLAQTIRDSYYLARGSITASLRRAVQAGSDLLYKRNLKASVEDRIVGGAVLVAMSGDDAFVAQVGPAAFYAVLGDHIQRYPARSVWLDEALSPGPDEEVTALGLNSVVEPALHHLHVASEDMLVLADSRLAGQLPLKDVVKAVTAKNVKTSVKNLAKVAQTRVGSALLLEVVEITSANIGPIKIKPPTQLGNLWSRKKPTNEASLPQPEPVATPVAEPELEPADEELPHKSAVFASTSIMQKPMEWLGKPADKDTLPRTPGRRDYVDEPVIEDYPEPDLQDGYQMDSVAPAYRSTMRDDTSSRDSFSIGKLFRPLGMALLTIIALLGGGIKNIASLLTPGSGQPRQAGVQARQTGSAIPWKTLRNIAIAIPVLVIIIVGVSYLQKGRLQEAEYQDFLNTAQSKFDQAQSVDMRAALGLMAEAEAALAQAEQIKSGQPEITELRQLMAEYTDAVENVHRLYYLPQLRQYTDPGTQLNDIVVEGVEVYVMDSGNDRIYHHRLDDLGEALLPDDETVLMAAKGQTVEEISVGDMLAMTWMPTGGDRQTSDLVILNSSSLMEFNPNWGITTATLAGTDLLKQPTAVDSYFGNFYILDPQANALLRYLPTADGYSAPPQSYFATDQPVDLAGAVDLAIDGAVYVLYQDGRIAKFLGGQPQEFNITGLNIPLNNPVAIYTAPDEAVQHIYVADAGNQRILQLNKDGSFVRQFKPRPGEAVSFANLQDIYVDEIGGKLFVLDSNNLYLGTIPTDIPTTEAPEAPPETSPPAN